MSICLAGRKVHNSFRIEEVAIGRMIPDSKVPLSGLGVLKSRLAPDCWHISYHPTSRLSVRLSFLTLSFVWDELHINSTLVGKRRIFAIGNYVTQRLLKPVPDLGVLRMISMDGRDLPPDNSA